MSHGIVSVIKTVFPVVFGWGCLTSKSRCKATQGTKQNKRMNAKYPRLQLTCIAFVSRWYNVLMDIQVIFITATSCVILQTILLLLLVRQIETPVSSMKVAVHAVQNGRAGVYIQYAGGKEDKISLATGQYSTEWTFM